MAIVTDIRTARKFPIRHYAFLGDTPGIATLVAGGYSFRPDDGRPSKLAAYNDPHLVLLGRIDLAEEQRAIDEAAGGLAAKVCGGAQRVPSAACEGGR
jgi:hypothetical protein